MKVLKDLYMYIWSPSVATGGNLLALFVWWCF